MTRILFLLFVISFLPTSSAQKHDYHWVLGYGGNGDVADTSSIAGGIVMDFATSPPARVKQNLKMNFNQNVHACSDSMGNLLYYTNGIRIRDRTFELMENGDMLNPGTIWNNNQDDFYPGWGTFSIPFPGHSNQYILFHLGVYLNNGLIYSPFYYTVIDMNMNNGLGAVIDKNHVLLQGNFNQPTAVKHANGRDWWVVIGQYNEPKYFVFLVNEQGISAPQEQMIGDPYHFPAESGNSIFSPDGTLYVQNESANGCRVHLFDRCTGQLSHYRILQYDTIYGSFHPFLAMFSEDSRFLYIGSTRYMAQVDMWADSFTVARTDTIQMTDWDFNPFPGFVTLFYQGSLAPDNKIYMCSFAETMVMHVMHHPNLPGQACDLENSGLGLPRFNGGSTCLFPNYRLGAWEGSPCDTLLEQHPPDGFVKTAYSDFLERKAQLAARSSPHAHLENSAQRPLQGRKKGKYDSLDGLVWERLQRQLQKSSAPEKKEN